jgi:hypothetical protein
MMITHVVKFEDTDTDDRLQSTDTAATIADFLLRATATNLQVCNIS